ncbi:thioether cross-link-forming SCIFF peptide maturase [Thermosyntropha sp.]|uniref:thioether cross-link-forming SCIFF peptide maturase n=1 Tax=Thermosyntropha sp. TaxID=2740820 RepID=UPI0025D8D150|nr:thioether cross-link-forming SCIFF peptide maturase [Thermosyntropha sp.]MBO8159641.1 thioether cross-link-forming SCIFF peptide maturase [Thermosyntropha sp.]
MNELKGYNFKADVHLYEFDGVKIFLDVNSGAVHLLDDLAFMFLSNLVDADGDFSKAVYMTSLRYPIEEVKEVEEEIKEAVKQKTLFTSREKIDLDLNSMRIKALCLNVAHVCNMKCRYCFAGQGNFGGKPSLMSKDTGKKALDFLVQRSGNIRNLEVDFFGGEPLLNFEVVKSLIAYGRELEKKTGKKFNFTLTTNAVLLNEKILDYLVDENISLILSLDGRKETNDRNRILNNGQGTYDLIVPHIKMTKAKKPISFYVRGTFTRDNLDFVSDVKHIVDLGIDALSLEPAVGENEDEFAIKKEDLPQVLKEYENLTRLLWEYYERGKEILFFHYNLNLMGGPCIAKRITGCGAGFEYLAVTPEGDIYPCHQFIGDDCYYMGNVWTGELREEIKAVFAQNNLNNKEECLDCWARYFCGGGCHANNLKRNCDMKKPDEISCTMHRKRIEGAIYLDIMKRLQKNNPLAGI